MLIKRALRQLSLEAVLVADVAELDPTTVDNMIDDGHVNAQDAEEGIHKLHSASVALEELYEMITADRIGNERPQLGKKAAMAVGITLEHINATLGFPAKDLNVALESFEGRGDENADATELVLESIAETLKKVWEALLAFVRKVIDWVKDNIDDNFKILSDLERRGYAIIGKANEIEKALDGDWEKFEITDEVLCKRLFIKGKDSSRVNNNWSYSTENFDNIYKHATEGEVFTLLKDVFLRLKAKDQDFKYTEALRVLMQCTQAYAKQVFKGEFHPEGVPQVPDDCTPFSTGAQIGCVGWYYFMPDSPQALNRLAIGRYDVDEGKYDSITSFEFSQVRAVCLSIRNIRDSYHNARDHVMDFDRIAKDIETHVQAKSEAVAGESVGRVSLISPLVRAAVKLMLGVTPTTFQANLRSARDVLRICEMSIKHQKVPQGDHPRDTSLDTPIDPSE